MALGSCSTAASCSRLVDDNGLASSTGGRGRASTWQLKLSYRAVRASTDEQRTGYALGVAIVPTAQRRSHDVRSYITSLSFIAGRGAVTSRLLARGARAAEVLRVEGAGCSSCETSGVWRGAVRTFELFPRYFKSVSDTRGRAGHAAVNSQRHWERGLQYCRFRALLAPRCRPAGLKCAV